MAYPGPTKEYGRCSMRGTVHQPLVPAKAGTQGRKWRRCKKKDLDSRLRGNERGEKSGAALPTAHLHGFAFFRSSEVILPLMVKSV